MTKVNSCDNEFCIYQRNNKCILEYVTLDVMGLCSDCIYIDIDTNHLEYYKSKLNKQHENFKKQNSI